ncbi:MAG: flagellar biosynthesis protein FlhB [Alphaproteobacteria bacterium]
MADDEDQSSKTEEPSQRKLDKLREEGNMPNSREVGHVFALLGTLIVVGLVGPWTMANLLEFTGSVLQNAGTVRLVTTPDMGAVITHAMLTGLMYLMPILLVFMVLGYVAGFIQTGGNISTKPLSINLEKISPMAGFKRMFSLKSVAELIKAIIKFGIIGAGMVALVYGKMEDILHTADSSLLAALSGTHRLMLEVIAVALLMMLLLAMVDYLFQRFQYMQQHMMSRKEMKDEFKESEGDPHVKQRQRQIRLERSRKRMMSNVPKADVVITNPTHYSVALRYKPEEGDAAPTLLAKGLDHMAIRIREVAREHNIPLYEDAPLARTLYAQVEIDDEIPLQLYEVVAKVMAFVMELKKKRRAA